MGMTLSDDNAHIALKYMRGASSDLFFAVLDVSAGSFSPEIPVPAGNGSDWSFEGVAKSGAADFAVITVGNRLAAFDFRSGLELAGLVSPTGLKFKLPSVSQNGEATGYIQVESWDLSKKYPQGAELLTAVSAELPNTVLNSVDAERADLEVE